MLKALAQDDLSAAFIKGDSPLNNVGSLYCKQQVLISLLVMCYKSYYLLLLYSCFFLQKNQHKTGQIGHRKILHMLNAGIDTFFFLPVLLPCWQTV